MKGLFAWYVYALLALMLVGAGVSRIIGGNPMSGGGYIIGGLLLFGLATVSGRWKNTNKPQAYQIDQTTLLPVVKSLIAEGKKEDAIRRIRVLTGMDLKEAKTLVDTLAEEQAQAMKHMDQCLRDMIGANKTIEALKYYREVTGAGLSEAKAYIAGLSQKNSQN